MVKEVVSKNPILFILIIIFILLNIGDVITTFFILPGESNPLYILTGSLFWPFFLKITVISLIVYLYYNNRFKSNLSYYLLTLILVLGTLLVGMACVVNTNAILNKEVIENASTISNKDKIQSYGLVMLFLYVIPAIINIGTFIIYDKTIKKVNIVGKSNITKYR